MSGLVFATFVLPEMRMCCVDMGLQSCNQGAASVRINVRMLRTEQWKDKEIWAIPEIMELIHQLGLSVWMCCFVRQIPVFFKSVLIRLSVIYN